MTTTLKEEFVEDVIGLLSGNLVDVELNEEDIRVAFRQAKRTWQQKGSDNTIRGFIPLEVQPGINTYQLPKDVSDVNEIIKEKGYNGLVSEEPFAMAAFQEMFSYGSQSQSGGNQFYIYDLTMQTIENQSMYLASEPNFKFNRSSSTLSLYNPPQTPRKWLMDVYKTPSDEEYQDQLWILNWTVAECKAMLGRAYRKLGTLPSPTGESQTDGDQLVQESIREKELLLEDIDNFVDGDPDCMGVYIG